MSMECFSICLSLLLFPWAVEDWFWRGCGEIGTLFHCWWECKLVQTLWKTVWRFLKDPEIEISFDPAIPLVGIYPKNFKLFCYEDTRTKIFILALFTIAMNWNQRKCLSMMDWTRKMSIYTMEFYAAIKNDEFESFVGTWMNLETISLSKLIQKQKIKHCMFSFIDGCWTLRTQEHREGSITHWGLLVRGQGRDSRRMGRPGRNNTGRNATSRWQGRWRQQITLPCVYLYDSPT